MEIYSQRDPRWADKELGKSGLKFRDFGCTVTTCAQALTHAGWGVTPGELVDKLNSIGGFTADGLLIWAKVGEAFPQFHFGGNGYRMEYGRWGKFYHWVLNVSGQIFEPFYGKQGYPGNFSVDGARTASVDVKPAPAPVVEPVVEKPVAAPETPKVSERVVVSGDTLGQIVLDHYGDVELWGDEGRVAMVAKYNGLTNPDLIHPGDIIKLP
jgi:hypothetical protein